MLCLNTDSACNALHVIVCDIESMLYHNSVENAKILDLIFYTDKWKTATLKCSKKRFAAF